MHAQKFMAATLVALLCATAAMAQDFPLWEHLLKHYGGKSDGTPVPSMKMGNHMQMSLKHDQQPGDQQRAAAIIAPLSFATWHRHVDFCGAGKNLPISEQFGPNASFGPQGSIHTEEDCRQAEGLWIPVVFGWMTHVYPDAKIKWGGMDMEMQSNAGEP